MQLKECFDAFGGNYQDVKMRLNKDELIIKFLKKFLSDTSYDDLKKSVIAKDYKEAFRHAHALKGICLNLGLEKLALSSSEMTDCLRNFAEEAIDEKKCESLMENVSVDYKEVYEILKQLD